MTAQRPRPAQRQRQRTDRDRQETVAALSERAAAQLRLLVTGEDWEAMLRLTARLPGWDFTNVMLIAAQRPDATLVAGYQAWQARGRQVRRGEPGIQVIAEPGGSPGERSGTCPPDATDSPGRIVSPRREMQHTYVWDITQTSGPGSNGPVTIAPTADRTPPGLWDALTWLARREGFAATRGDSGTGPGVTEWAGRRIRIRSDLRQAEAALALAHELGHVLAHDGLALAPGASTVGCRGIHKIEADSIALVVAMRLGLNAADRSWPHVASWAGSDPRSRPEETVREAGSRIIAAAAQITAHVDAVTDTARPQNAATFPAQSADRSGPAAGAGIAREPASSTAKLAASDSLHADTADAVADRPLTADISRALLDAEQFYLDRLHSRWVPAYLGSRGLSQATWARWRLGYASAGWTTLVDHLRGLGHDDQAIEAAGLARRSSRGTLIDHFRDRVMLAIRDEHGTIAGFIGRAHPQAGPAIPKYLNSPETPVFTKGDLLFGLHQARHLLASGAVPVIAEGPFDAIAISEAIPGRYAGLAPCGTALTGHQVAALGRATDLGKTGILVALDGDRAGREATIRAHGILLPATAMAAAVILPPGRDPADILRADGPTALAGFLQHHAEPLAQLVISAHLDSWASQLGHAEGRLWAMRSAASVIASLLPPETADRILQITGGRAIATLDQNLRPVANSELPMIARILPASATCQIVRVADRLETELSEVTSAVANSVHGNMTHLKSAAPPGTQTHLGNTRAGRVGTDSVPLASSGFPDLLRRPETGPPDRRAANSRATSIASAPRRADRDGSAPRLHL